MATVLFGNGVADMRGSVNGNVFARNANGAYVRNRTTPINPQTAKQISVRNALASVATYWRSLTDAQREAWNVAAPSFPYTNRLGQTQVYTGQQLFMKFNQQLLQAGISLGSLDTPPAPATFPDMALNTLAFTLTASVLTTAQFAVDNPDATGDFRFNIFATPGLSAGISSPGKSQFRLVANKSTGSDPTTFVTEYIALFGSPTIASKVHVRVEVVNVVTGQMQIAFLGAAVVA